MLEDVALEARRDSNDRLVIVTNVRRIATNLGISKDTAARALARLAHANLVVRQFRRRSTSGAFAPSAYELHLNLKVGLALVTAERGSPRRAVPDASAAPVADSSDDPRDSRRADDVAPRPRRRRRRASSADQRALFEMGSETSERR